MSKKTKTNLAEVFHQYPELSLRKVALATELNYNMLLKQGKKPILGVPYDPELINFPAVEGYMRKKLGEGFEDINWQDIAELKVATKKSGEAVKYEVNDLLTLRADDRTYQVKMVTETHIVIMAVDDTRPRVFSYPTFKHQCPKKFEPAQEQEQQSNVKGGES